MSPIQILLITLLLLAAVWSSVAFGSRLVHRLTVLVFFLAASGFVLFPAATTRVAHFVGVGRGADLLLYVSLFAGVYGFLLLYMRMRRLEKRVNDQVRALAIYEAQRPGNPPPE
jgi:hypothetical protein